MDTVCLLYLEDCIIRYLLVCVFMVFTQVTTVHEQTPTDVHTVSNMQRET